MSAIQTIDKPQINGTKPRNALRMIQSESEMIKCKRTRRPATKPFDPEEIRAISGEIISNDNFFMFEGNRYSRKEFLNKLFTMGFIVTERVIPTLSKLEQFEEAPEDIDIEFDSTSAIGDSRKNNINAMNSFSSGDNVVVCERELMNLQEKIVSIDGNKMMVMPKHRKLEESFEFQTRELRKYFKMGDHVKVLAGKYEGDTGIIIRVESNRVVLFSNLSMHELDVSPGDLQLCLDIATDVDSPRRFQWGELVQLNSQTVGVIVRLERENIHVLSMHGKVVEARPQGSIKRRENRACKALDHQRNTIQKGDIVKVVDGSHAGQGGEIKYIYRSFAFLHSRVHVDNSRIFVCKTRHLQLASDSKAGVTSMTPTLRFMSPRIAPLMHSNEGGERDHRRSVGTRRYHEIIGTTIKITSGPYEGSIGTIKDYMGSTARVELYSTCHTILVDESYIANVDVHTKDVRFSSYNRMLPYAVDGRTSMYAQNEFNTIMYASQTSMHESGLRTPHYSSVTPSHDGSRTPSQSGAWNPTVTNIPAQDFVTPSRICYSSLTLEVPGSPYKPQTLGADLEADKGEEMIGNYEWHTVDIEVRIKDAHEFPALAGQLGIIRGISGNMCAVFMPAEDRVVNFTCKQLEPVIPKLGDRVKIVVGEDCETVGTLIAIDNQDSLVKLNTGEILMIYIRFICKMKSA